MEITIGIMGLFIIYLLCVLSAKSKEIREVMIMSLLLPNRELYGLDLVKESKGVLRRGLIYLDLQRLEEYGSIVSRNDPGFLKDGIRRRMFRIKTGD